MELLARFVAVPIRTNKFSALHISENKCKVGDCVVVVAVYES